jgi:hypothetical protein
VRSFLFLVLSFALSASAAPNRKVAAAHFHKATRLAEAGEDAAALVEFQAAWEVGRRWEVLFDLGLTESRLLHYGAAVAALNRYLDEGGARVPKARRARALRTLAGVRDATATVRVRVEGAPARILVDGEVVGLTPMQPLLVAVGRHTFRAERPGEAAEEVVDLVARAERDLALAPAAPKGAPIELTVETSPTGAVINLDGNPLGLAPTTAKVLPGTHELSAELGGFPTQRATVELKESEPRTVTLRFEPEATVAGEAAVEASPASPAPFPVVGVIVSAAGLALVGGAIACNVFAQDQAKQVSLLYLVGGTWGAQGQAVQTAGITAQTWSWVLGLAGAAVLTTGLVLTALKLFSPRQEEVVSLWLAPAPGGLAFGGSLP